MSYHAPGQQELLYGINMDSIIRAKDLKNVKYRVGLLGINAVSATAPTIYTTDPASGLFYPTRAIFIVQAANTVTVPAQVSIGVTGSGYNDILANTTLTGLTAAGKYIVTALVTSVLAGIAVNTPIVAKFNVNATATSETIAIFLEGFYEDFGVQQVLPTQ